LPYKTRFSAESVLIYKKFGDLTKIKKIVKSKQVISALDSAKSLRLSRSLELILLSQCRKKEARRTKFKSLEVREASSSHLKIMFKSRIAFHFVFVMRGQSVYFCQDTIFFSSDYFPSYRH